jgi:hypothetical protein
MTYGMVFVFMQLRDEKKFETDVKMLNFRVIS